MSYQASQPEWATVFDHIRAFEGVTGLIALKIEPEPTSVRVEWGYPDATWAGSNTYDLPLERVLEKLDQQINHEKKRAQLGLPKRATGELPSLELIAEA